MNKFSEILTALIESSALTQKELAKNTHIPPPTINGWLLYNHKPDILSLQKLADYFQVSTDFLLGRTTSEQTNGTVLTPEEKIILKTFRELDERNKKNAIATIKAIGEVQKKNL